jgi:hypothetical protein
MAESDRPDGPATDTALSFDAGVEDISNLLLSDPETDPAEEQEHEANADAEPGDEPGPDEAEADAEDDESDGSDEVAAGGKFVSRDAKVRLDDGTVISVGELARNNLFQRDYTRKSEEVKAERQAVQADRTKMNEIAQALVAQRDFLLQYSERKAPKAPPRDMLETDPIGYWRAKAEYDDDLAEYNTLQHHRQAEAQRLQEEAGEALKAFKSEEARKLFDKIPEFRKPEVYNKFWSDAQQVMSEKYGISPEELAETYDHRMYSAMRDLVKYHKAQAAAPKVKEQLQGKPQMMKGGKRMDPKSKISREAQGRAEQLRKTGSLQAGIAALMDLDL